MDHNHGVTKLSTIEYSALRSELLVRIILQNALLILVVVAFLFSAEQGLYKPNTLLPISLGFVITAGAFALQWSHHGIRTEQIKRFIVALESEDKHELGWEIWLSNNRPNSFLGSRWMISTKGVFIGLQTAMIMLSLAFGESVRMPLVAACILLTIGTAYMLFTEPKD